MRTIEIALTGELDESVVAHRAIPRALALAGAAVGCKVTARWVPTSELLPDPAALLQRFHGHWCVPNSPYASEEGALAGIADSRRSGRPYLGTCAGFQHAVLEYARDVAGVAGAAHEETSPSATALVVNRLSCSLVERVALVHFVPGSRIARAYGRFFATEGYNCNFGLNAEFRGLLERAGLVVSAVDDDGDVRAIEIPDHPFFVATLFQPERSALASRRPHPLIAAFVEAARRRAAGDEPGVAAEAVEGAGRGEEMPLGA
ncbi:MAG TPA: hypothetical protein VF832_02560 [Longimicrobiales bacterium]